ncbi:MAG TPA: SRPBCC domain-containing protein [Acidimicrobiales bacterium]|nr:SRPBCC domain-containing protein [Acidimicrobiales bacterium]
MKLHEEFDVDQPPEAIWSFFEHPEKVSSCMPGIEGVEVIDDDNVEVRATQSIGPMSATFDAKVTVLERIPNELIRFQAIGQSIRGAAGNLRTMNVVRLVPLNGSTKVVIDGDVALAGALGSVGQKVVAKQASKVTAEFARNLERSLRGEEFRPPLRPPAAVETFGERPASVAPSGGPDPWVRLAAVLSVVSAVLSIVAILRTLGRARRDRLAASDLRPAKP